MSSFFSRNLIIAENKKYSTSHTETTNRIPYLPNISNKGEFER